MPYNIENHYPLFRDQKINNLIQDNINIALSLKEGEHQKNVYSDDLFVIPQNTLLKSSQNCIYELHKEYIDIHYMIKGKETINLLKLNDVKKPFEMNIQSDYYLYKSKVSPRKLVLSSSQLVIFTFDNVHKVGIQSLENVKSVIKIVIKIKKNLFDKDFINE